MFKVRQRVRARNINPTGHTRLPVTRAETGVIERDHGVYIFPDTNAHAQGEKRQHVYSVRFTAREFWGEGASPRDSVHLDLWDDYLERVSSPTPARVRASASPATKADRSSQSLGRPRPSRSR